MPPAHPRTCNWCDQPATHQDDRPRAIPEVCAQHYHGAQLYRALTALLNSAAITEKDADARGYAGAYRQARAIIERVERAAARQ